ncbi:hypothetical protein BGW38_003629 [Lunasporangiospora selenospora]|uniref:Fatty acid desaturase domain-containing protein n=1 Tax=Lunasporangiospora selenospora TaxID=979761 RepID=A0A9P6G1M8_9FUNG|nr:hypothetical protein BGW38_003629 [Lunasporangiospora selenospora]
MTLVGDIEQQSSLPYAIVIGREEDIQSTPQDGEEGSSSSSPILNPTDAVQATAKAATSGENGPKIKRLSLISSEDLKTPTIAVPTIAVAAGSLAVWGSILYYGAYKRKVSPVLTFPLMTAACFASFTPVHDATHSSVAKGVYKKPVNWLVGYLSGIPLCLPFSAYRKLHLLHHRYTNTEKDPDVWDAQGPMVARFFKWFFPDGFWIKAVLGGITKGQHLSESAIYYLAMMAMIRKFHTLGMAYVKYWLIPQRMAYWLLMWLFAYVPHRPDGDHQFSAADNIYKMTNVTGGILRSDGFNLAIPLLNQHLHNIHHLYPQLPFTRYGAIWSKHKDALIEAGTEIHPVYSSKQGWKWNERLDGTQRNQ